MTYRKIHFFVIVLFTISLSQPCMAERKAQEIDAKKVDNASVQIHLVTKYPGRHIRPEVSGTNIMSTADSKFSLPENRKKLADMGIKTLRFPGGTLAQNYDWKTNTFLRQDIFPFDNTSDVNYLEFLRAAKEAGISNIFFVVNVSGAYFEPGSTRENVERYADSAAAWVKAVKAAGYFVPYWEIGNEAYLRAWYPMTANEYAADLSIFYKKMKAADPRIMIGAIGPHTVHGEKSIAFADALGDRALRKLRHRILDEQDYGICKKEEKKTCLDDLGEKKQAKPTKVGWWEVLSDRAKGSFDFAVIHRYGSVSVSRHNNKGEAAELEQEISKLKSLLESRRGSPVMLALTEWNLPTHGDFSESDHALQAAIQMGMYLSGGVDYALYWPLSLKNNFPLLHYTGGNQPAVSAIYKMFSDYHEGNICQADYDRFQGVYVLCTSGPHWGAVMLVNVDNYEKKITLTLDNSTAEVTQFTYIASDANGNTTAIKQADKIPSARDGKMVFVAAPGSVNWIKIRL